VAQSATVKRGDIVSSLKMTGAHWRHFPAYSATSMRLFTAASYRR
jgi:hypothetical protein